jgi:hypothetical protein
MAFLDIHRPRRSWPAAVAAVLGCAAVLALPAAAGAQARPGGRAPLPARLSPSSRPAAAISAGPSAGTAPGAAPPAGSLDVNFPATPVGSTSTATCASECFSLDSGAPGNCDGSGTIAIDKPLAAPFAVTNFRVTSASGCGGTPVSLPVDLRAGESLLFDFTFTPTENGSFTDTLGLGGLTWTLSGSTPGSGACTADASTLCLDDARFQVRADWRTADGRSGSARAVPLTADTGYLWFFNADNVEVVVKVLDGCGLNNHFWVFAAGLTDVRVAIHVTDTRNQVTNDYLNHLGTAFQPLQDTSAFPCG